ncbi:hypothetical protein ACFLS9_05580 [Bacteroidota bacterium]
MRNEQNIFSLALVLIGILYLLRVVEIVSIDNNMILSCVFIIYGVSTLYLSIGARRKGLIFFSVSVFLIGIILLVVRQFEILNTSNIILPATYFVLGSSFLLLYVDNFIEKYFLVAAIVFYLFCYLAIALYKKVEIIELANRITLTVIDYWPSLLILLGIGIFLNRNKK